MTDKICNKLVLKLGFYIEKILQKNPKAAKLEVVQRLKTKMHCLLRQKRIRDAEELAFEILYILEPLRTDKEVSKEVVGR